MPTGEPAEPARRQRGFTYLWLLFALALGGVALAAMGELETTRQQREREAELRFRGEAIAAALGRYAETTPLGHAPLPERLEDLLADRRFPKPRRHLRQLYADPFTGHPDWEPVLGEAPVVVPEGAASQPVASGIVGVRSRSGRMLMASVGGHRTAHDWIFRAAPAPSSQPEP